MEITSNFIIHEVAFICHVLTLLSQKRFMHLSEKSIVLGQYIKTNQTFPFKQSFNTSYPVAILLGMTPKKIYY